MGCGGSKEEPTKLIAGKDNNPNQAQQLYQTYANSMTATARNADRMAEIMKKRYQSWSRSGSRNLATTQRHHSPIAERRRLHLPLALILTFPPRSR